MSSKRNGRVTRLLLGAVGLASTGLGVLGLWLPGLPTTPFVLLALWAFSRSSPRLHGWLSRIPLLAAALAEAKRFEEQRAIRGSVKLTALATAWGSLVLLALATGASQPVVLGIVFAAAAAGSLFLWLIPTAEAAPAETSDVSGRAIRDDDAVAPGRVRLYSGRRPPSAPHGPD